MKKIFIGLLLLLFCSNANAGTYTRVNYVTGNDVTIDNMNKNNSLIQETLNGNVEGGINVKAGSLVSQDFSNSVSVVQYRNEAFNDWTYTGMLAPTSADATSITTAGISYVEGVRVSKDAESHTYNASKDTYVYIVKTGSYQYEEVANGAAAPTTPSMSLLLFKVVTSVTPAITSVTDLRTLSIQITANSSNFGFDYRDGALIVRDSATAVHAEPGQIAIGTNYYTNVADTSTLSNSTATSWVENSVPNRDGLFYYVYAYNSAGTQWSIKYCSADPAYSDTSSNTGGTKRYYTLGGVWYRALGWISSDNNATAGNIQTWNMANLSDTKTSNIINRISGDLVSFEGVAHTHALDDNAFTLTEGDEYMKVPFKPTNANNMINVKVNFVWGNASSTNTRVAIFRNGDTNPRAEATNRNADANGMVTLPVGLTEKAGTTTKFEYIVRAASDGGTLNMNGYGGARKGGGFFASTILVTEYEA